MSTKKKTAKKKQAKKAPTKQAKAFEATLEAFKKPEQPTAPGWTVAEIHAAQLQAFLEEGDIQFDADGNVMGPLGDMRAVKLGGETISLEEADAQDGISPEGFDDIQPEAPSLPAHEPSKASQPPSGHIVPQTPYEAPQTAPTHINDAIVKQAQEIWPKLGEGADLISPDIDRQHAAQVVLDLIEGMNYLHSVASAPSKRLKEHDTPILQGRVKLARELVAQLRLAE